MSLNLWLKPIPHPLRAPACAALEAGDLSAFFCTASNEASLELVFHNHDVLMKSGLYEKALINAFVATRTNNHHWPLHLLRRMFALADRTRLRAVGNALPGPGPFTIYRGVAGSGAAQRVRGISWTACRETARWFARRYNLPNPDVFCSVVNETDVLVYTNRRNEEEFLVPLPDNNRPDRLPRIEGPILKTPSQHSISLDVSSLNMVPVIL
jgi:hypothetical protein